MNAGEVGGTGARVVARTVAQRVGLVMVEPGEDGEVLAKGFERFQNPRELDSRGPSPSGVHEIMLAPTGM